MPASNREIPTIHSEVHYLEMRANPRLLPVDLRPLELRRARNLPVSHYLHLYREIGRDYLWNYRPGQNESEIAALLNAPHTWLYLLSESGKDIGLAEIDAKDPNDIELVHFGLFPAYIGRGIGRRFLESVLQIIWETTPTRVWLSTCGMDHPDAVRFYERAGFSRFKTLMGEFKDWRFSGFYDMTDAPQVPFAKK